MNAPPPLLDRMWMRLRSLFVPSVTIESVQNAVSADKVDEAVLQLYTWERDRLLTLAKGLGGAAVTVLTGLIASAIKGEVTGRGVIVAFAALLVAELLGWGAFVLTGLHRLAEQYPVALGLVH
jgi:hypothetical protein